MSLLKVFKHTIDAMPQIEVALKEAFDEMDKIPFVEGSDPDYNMYRVSKVSLGLIYGSDDYATVQMKEVSHSVVPAGVDKCKLQVTAINDIGLDPTKNYSPLPIPCVTEKHKSQGSSHGVKSKG